MSPNDQYLCIVPSGSVETFGRDKVFLPFEGDRILSIVLSKAFMLAEDGKITDPTIVRQIK
jgi:molybdopterin-guanine dinucleotide biosynthesis protein A